MAAVPGHSAGGDVTLLNLLFVPALSVFEIEEERQSNCAAVSQR